VGFNGTTLNEIAASEGAGLYLDLMKKCLTRTLFPESLREPLTPGLFWKPAWLYRLCNSVLRALDIELLRRSGPVRRGEGKDWPQDAETMIGLARLNNIQDCVTDVLRNGVPGDLIETGVWRGGACIFMRAILRAYGDRQRTVWVADSFLGLPKPDTRYPQDASDRHWHYKNSLGVPLDQVKANFHRYGLLDNQVKFVEGWFRDTLPEAPIGQISVLRLDGDMYSSTMDALVSLYPKLVAGGYAIIDDYGAVVACRNAVNDFRAKQGVREPLREIDWTGVFWKKE
jgi:O-methyltransferase